MTDGRKKVQFAALPLRALNDDRLTDRDVRILGVVASHDRMSGIRGKGQGAWASHKTMAAEVGGGADYARFSVSINKLVAFGYLQRDRLEGDARMHTYRVIYTDEDRLPQRKPSGAQEVCLSANQLSDDGLPNSDGSDETVCRHPNLSVEKDSETPSQYISRSEERDSAEAGEIDSAEAARFVARDTLQVDRNLSIGANLARLERALRRGSRIAREDWFAYLVRVDASDVQESAQISRLFEELAERMTGDERKEARLKIHEVTEMRPAARSRRRM